MKEKTSKEEIIELLKNISNYVYKDPVNVINIAKEIDTTHLYDEIIAYYKSSILIDGGSSIKDMSVVKEGVNLLEQYCEKDDCLPNLKYNLANGYSILIADICQSYCLSYLEDTRDKRIIVRQYFWEAVQSNDKTLSSMALTNIGNQFYGSSRWEEANDAYHAALEADMANGVAAYRAAKTCECFYKNKADSESAYHKICCLARHILMFQDSLPEYTGEQEARKIIDFAKKWPNPSSNIENNNPFIKWISEERLALSSVITPLNSPMNEIDDIRLPNFIWPLTESHVTPPILGMFNVLIGNFQIARKLTWDALPHHRETNTVYFTDTLDSALYGEHISSLTLAHKATLDLLDQIAIFANYYFDLAEEPNKVSFVNLWRTNKKREHNIPPMKDKVKYIINSGVNSLYGIVEMADDFNSRYGILSYHKKIRNISTHRFLILHEYLTSEEKENSYEIGRYEYDNFLNKTLHALRLSRSALQNLVRAVTENESIKRNKNRGILVAKDITYKK